MLSQSLALENRVTTLNAVLAAEQDRQAVGDAVRRAIGNLSAALASLQDTLPPETLQKITLAHTLAEWSNDHIPLVTTLIAKPNVTQLRDVALQFNIKNLSELIPPDSLPPNTAGNTPDEKRANFALTLQNKLFTAEPSAVLQRMIQDAEIPIADPHHRATVATFLNNQPTFNIRTTSIYHAIKQPDAFNGIADEHRSAVIEHLKTLQRVQAISPVPAAVPVLMRANLISAYQVAAIPESTFLAAHGKTLGEETARQVHANAVNIQIRNEHALMTIRESVRGTGLAIIDGEQSAVARMNDSKAAANSNAVPLNLETLFGDSDHCACDDCRSVYSPAAYFVEILQYLRNNNLDPDKFNTEKAGISGTPLEKLFRRRPDLGCLELTCENTFTVLPYVDLVNEVMESFVVHLGKYHADQHKPKQATLDVFNVIDETTSELLAQPQHVNYQAYCILKSAAYPFTLPYHQPIDTIRIWLKNFGSSRFELLDTFRTANENCTKPVLTPAQQQKLKALHGIVRDRAADTEYLGLTQEETIILTHEAFWPKAYFDLTTGQTISGNSYREKIGVKSVHTYYGYDTNAEMLSLKESGANSQKGLTFIKKQFLPRTGIQYTDLVDLLKTRFINPATPQGAALKILESIRFSYRFLQTMVDPDTKKSVAQRFAKLVGFLNAAQVLTPQLDALLHPDLCHQHPANVNISEQDLTAWVYCYFERIGKLIVLESGDGPHLPLAGQVYRADKIGHKGALLGRLQQDGLIIDPDGAVVAHTDAYGKVLGDDGKPFATKFNPAHLLITDDAGDVIGDISKNGIQNAQHQPITWVPAKDSCDLDKVRLTHLDGSSLVAEEYDRIQRFIRLWRKIGWRIDEVDHALLGASAPPLALNAPGNALALSPANGLALLAPGFDDNHCVGFDIFQSDCKPDSHQLDSPAKGAALGRYCPPLPNVAKSLTVDFLHQLAAIRKLGELTGLPLDKLLALWSDIGINGNQSLYARLFLTHNLLAIDKVFQPDSNGNYLTDSTKISAHLPVLLAALKLKTSDIAAIAALRQLPDSLTLTTVSVLYRHALLAKLLHVQVSDLADIFALFNDPFQNPQAAITLLAAWGKMEEAGFNFRQLNYLIRNKDDAKHPLAPTKNNILRISKTLFDGLNAIDAAHPDVPAADKDAATADLIRAKGGLLYETAVLEQIIGLLEGTTVYSTNAPLDAAIKVPPSLAKLKYSMAPGASIQVTGILTDAEKIIAKALYNHPNWASAIDRVGKQAEQFFLDKLFGIFKNVADAKQKLLAGDVNLPPDPNDPNANAANTAPAKRYYFLQHFLPFLRRRLAHSLIVESLVGAASLPRALADSLLSDILKIGAAKQAAITALEQIHQKPAINDDNWKGYLIPAADGDYIFSAHSLVDENLPPAILIDGKIIAFSQQQLDPTNVWYSDPNTPIPLKNGNLYWLEVTGQPASSLMWRTAASPNAPIPAAALLPNYSSSGTEEVFVKLFKAALLVNGFNLNLDEVKYWQAHKADFDGFNFNAITLPHFLRLQAYCKLRNTLPKTDSGLLDLFKWAKQPDATPLKEKIAAATQWNVHDIGKLIAPAHFDLAQPAAFRNEINLVKLSQALQVATAIGADINRLFVWANPVSKFSVCHQIAEEIRASLRARYEQTDWEQVVKPLNDQLRENQKQALIAYLLVQQDLRNWGVVDADSLFEFFLIDVQMCACMETSRIKQAISSVQLFVQRCMLGLEAKYGVANDVLDRDRWKWMEKYRVWEANRKVFLYPENWIKPELRDDKSPFYKELESELMQKDINTQTITDALKNYLFKVDEVANLKVVGLYLEQGKDTNGGLVDVKLHVFGRTRNAPYFFYYRWFDCMARNWFAWEKMQVDIPSYEQEDENGKVIDHGTYLIPVVWNGRLLVFFPQFIKKSQAVKFMTTNIDGNNGRHSSIEEISKWADEKPAASTYWEVKLGWSECRNGKWTQKQISKDALNDSFLGYKPFTQPTFHMHLTWTEITPIQQYNFVPQTITAPSDEVIIGIFNVKDNDSFQVGSFHFQGSQITHVQEGGERNFPIKETAFHYVGKRTYSLQATSNGSPGLLLIAPYYDNESKSSPTLHEGNAHIPFSHPFVHDLLGELATGELDNLFQHYKNLTPQSSKDDAFGKYDQTQYHELKRAYSLYNWEAAFHAPMQLVDRLLAAQQFDQALNICHYVLNPYANGNDSKRFWQFTPFRDIVSKNALEDLFLGLQPNKSDNTPNAQINEWRKHPFQPHAVARSRPTAYMKYVAMKYIEILIAYGDYYFRQFTLETIPLAIQCYVLASHVYGPRGQKIPKRGKTVPQTYISLLNKWDAFGNAMVELELAFPFSNQTPLSLGSSNGVVGLANVFGFATTLYFGIPDNPQLTALRDTIDDRLFKIRHCEDIDGVFRQLPLFEPPIDPALLVQAAAQGLSISSVLNDLNSPMPNYRFYYLLQKALELCSEVKALGNAFLSVKERSDGEALSQLRAKHESSIHNLVMEVRKLQLDEAGKSLDALQQSRKGAVYRLQHYLKLVGDDSKVPDQDTDFNELPDEIEAPVDESGLRISPFEKEEMDKAEIARFLQIGIGHLESMGSMMNMIPNFSTNIEPLGVGESISFGGSNMGAAFQAQARSLQTISNEFTYQSSNASRKANFQRQLQDRIQQANSAGYEIKNIDKQILTQQIRISMAEQEIANQQKQIDNAQEVEEFLRSKYTNAELYLWMDSQVRTLYHQAYSLAYDMAKRAEKVFRFERAQTTSSFIQYGYWDNAYDGLYSGERLYIGLKQLEAAYQEKRGHDFELTKSISLRQVAPLALLRLKETGRCEFDLPEILFDMDFPGHYLRRIKSVSLRIPCTMGPHTSLNCTMRLLEHKYRTSPLAKKATDYPEQTDETDERFSTVNIPLTSIAVGSMEDESGVFELNFKDERYLPFEGAGAISKWRLELPDTFRQFDYDTITDIIIKLRYTSVDGGDKLRAVAAGTVATYLKDVADLSQEQGLFAVFDLINDFPNEWYAANHPAPGAMQRVMTINKLYEKLPVFTKGKGPNGILAKDIYLLMSTKLKSGKFSLVQGNVSPTSPSVTPVGKDMNRLHFNGLDATLGDLQITITDLNEKIDKLWLVERYVLM